MELKKDFSFHAEVLYDYFNDQNESLWLRQGLGGNLYTEIDTYNSLMESLQNMRRMFEGIPLTLLPFNSSNERFEIVMQNDQERLALISQLQIQFRERNDMIPPSEKHWSDRYQEEMEATSMGFSMEDIAGDSPFWNQEISLPDNSEILVKENTTQYNNQKSNIMETKIFESKKADLQVKIELPKQEKPFFDKMSTTKNLITQIQKAGQKLEKGESLNISINGSSFQIPKEKTEKENILESIQSEYDKTQKTDAPKKGTQESRETESQQNNIPTQKKEKTNLGYLKDQILYLGMGESPEIHKEIAKKMGSGTKEFSVVISSDKASFKDNKVDFTLNFQKSSSNNKVYLNNYQAHLTNEKKGTDLTHTFSARGGFTAKEAINLLEGRAVKTEMENRTSGEKEEVFVKLNFNEEKTEKGNFKLQVFNKNYGIDVEKIMTKANLVFDDEKHKEITQKSLEKGNIVVVKFSDQSNKITEGKAILNPQYKMLNLYDSKMKRVNSNEQAFQKDNTETAEVKNQQNHSRKM